MKEFTNVAGNVTLLPGMYIFFILAGYYAQGHDLKRFGTFCDTISTMALNNSDIGNWPSKSTFGANK